MAQTPDPYRVLELGRDATLDEIKRAYRRLAKQHHPDSGGERALPRFLEIQAAYEQLVGARGGTRRRPVAPTGPWQADDVRAEATRRAYGTRTRRTGARPAGRPGGGTSAGPTGTARPGGSADDAGERPPSGAGATTGTDGPADARGSRPPRRGRPANRATPGSTTYDGVEDEPFEPGWTGASWYGTTSGTYWTLNPKEYADPRKHGPEYQARARRRRNGQPDPGAADSPRPEAAGAEPIDGAPPGTARGRRRPRGAEPEPDPAAPAASAVGPDDGDGAADGTQTGPPGWSSTPETSPGASWSASPRAEPRARRSPPSWSWGSQPRDPGDDREPGDRRDPWGSATGRPGLDPFDPGPTLSELAGVLLRDPVRPVARLGLAVAGGAPLGLALAWLLGELTGCGRFAATCDPGVLSFAWLGGLALIGALVLLPSAASITTVGAVASFAAGIPATVLLSATGGARLPEASSAVLGVVLVVGWLAGVAYAIARRRSRSAGTGPVS